MLVRIQRGLVASIMELQMCYVGVGSNPASYQSFGVTVAQHFSIKSHASIRCVAFVLIF